jgi:tRNA 2-thiocytidine biosynthesis protein TtcA
LQRQAIKAMLRAWEKQAPGRLDSIFAGLCHVAPSHLADTRLFDFLSLGAPAGSKPGRLKWLPGDPEEPPAAVAIPVYRRSLGGEGNRQNEQFDLSNGAW